MVNGRLKERYLLLLSDTLILCKLQVLKQYKYLLEFKLDLHATVLNVGTGTRHTGTKLTKTQVEVVHPSIPVDDPLILNFSTEVERAKWTALMEQCFKTLGGVDAEKFVAGHVLHGIEAEGSSASATNSTHSLGRALTLPPNSVSSVRKSNTMSLKKRTTGLFVSGSWREGYPSVL